MGGAQSVASTSLGGYIQSQYDLVKAADQPFLTVKQAMTLTPPRDYPLDFSHVATLWVIDSNKDGRFTADELMAFGDYCCQVSKHIRTHEFQIQVQASCTVTMWNALSRTDGEDAFTEWFTTVLKENGPISQVADYPGVDFLGRDTVGTLYEMLNARRVYGIDLQGFFDLMQQVGEEMGIMDIENESLDDIVPVVVVKQFCRDFIRGFRQMMKEVQLHELPTINTTSS
eukprot:GILJ01001097.1.p1 GENE.GILJ01001097.1~~GILJ01001097.1.p1  ORF type:complete len:228 (-),score=33.27 GILJ01001097.1:324-1007(-)